MYDTETILFAFALTLFAGLSTGIGSILALVTKKTNTRFLAVALGFSGGVMIYVSFAEILPKARDSLVSGLGMRMGSWAAAGSFFAGILVIAIIDQLVPSGENPHESRMVEEILPGGDGPHAHHGKLMRMGVMSALAIAIHNFPEGIATFAAALQDPSLGIAIAVAVAIHNIPEGLAVSVPIYFSTGSRRKAFTLSFLSGLAEPLGALLGYLLLFRILNDTTFGVLFGMVAGIMVFISLDELLPAAREYGEAHRAVYSMVAGMVVMAISLLLFV